MSQAWVNVQRAFLLLLSLCVTQSAFAGGQATALDGLQFLSRARLAAQRLDSVLAEGVHLARPWDCQDQLGHLLLQVWVEETVSARGPRRRTRMNVDDDDTSLVPTELLVEHQERLH